MTVVLGASAPTSPGGVTGWLLHIPGPAVYTVVGALVFAEAALMIGFFFPGETAVVVGGALAGLGRLNLPLLMVIVVVSAIVGDSVGYEVGRRAGPWLLSHRPLKGRAAVRRTLVLLERYGGPAVFFGRFTAFARAVVPGLAGMSGMSFRTFLPWNALGGTVWGVGFTVLGYVVGLSFERVLASIGRWTILVVVVLIAGVVVFEIVRRRRERSRIATEMVGEIEADAPDVSP